jgi:hypothetical protein
MVVEPATTLTTTAANTGAPGVSYVVPLTTTRTETVDRYAQPAPLMQETAMAPATTVTYTREQMEMVDNPRFRRSRAVVREPFLPGAYYPPTFFYGRVPLPANPESVV